MKDYRIDLYVGSIFIGTYQVEAFDLENAYEMAWELAQGNFWAEEHAENEKCN